MNIERFEFHARTESHTRCIMCLKTIKNNIMAMCVGFKRNTWRRWMHCGCFDAVGDGLALTELLQNVEPTASGAWFNNGGQLV